MNNYKCIQSIYGLAFVRRSIYTTSIDFDKIPWMLSVCVHTNHNYYELNVMAVIKHLNEAALSSLSSGGCSFSSFHHAPIWNILIFIINYYCYLSICSQHCIAPKIEYIEYRERKKRLSIKVPVILWLSNWKNKHLKW